MAEDIKDLFMQFMDFGITLGSDSSELQEDAVSTTLSLRGNMMMLIHKVECDFGDSIPEADNRTRVVFSVTQDLAQMPDFAADRTITGFTCGTKITTSGRWGYVFPAVLSYLPPVPLATAEISMYAATAQDEAGLQNQQIQARICFTFAKLDRASYLEVAEVWGWR